MGSSVAAVEESVHELFHPRGETNVVTHDRYKFSKPNLLGGIVAN